MKYLLIPATLTFFIFVLTANANFLPDTDNDGVPDYDEENVYMTDPNNSDTDGDGYSDREELMNGYSPHSKGNVKLEDSDIDNDGLSDRMELNFSTNLKKNDTDGDGFMDGEEVRFAYDPLQANGAKLDKRIEINTRDQELGYFLGGVLMDTFLVSSGLNDSTPKGNFQIQNKSIKAWSSYGLWMPYWMAITKSGKYGIHELPVWPNGYREGEDHLGTPVSHGCVRLGLDSARFMYEWSEIGTPVFIY